MDGKTLGRIYGWAGDLLQVTLNDKGMFQFNCRAYEQLDRWHGETGGNTSVGFAAP